MTRPATLREALVGLDGLRFVMPMQREEQMVSTGFEASSVEAETVGGEEFAISDVPQSGRTEFTHFLDGAQRTWQFMYRRLSPIMAAHTSAAILERIDGEIQPPDDGTYEGAMEAFVPDDPQLAQALAPLIDVQPVGVRDTPPGGLDELVRKAISDRRDAMEQRLAQLFTSGKLLIDGGIGKALRHQGAQPFVVGLVKSHRKQYFRSAKRMELILGMQAGQRSSLFIRPADSLQGESVYSFYLRLHDGQNVGPLHGIVRIEMPADSSYREQVDEVAGWILHERDPLSLPDFRFDKLLYPIRLVEQHLKARQPSTASILGLVG